MSGKTAILSIRIIGDATSSVKAYDESAAAGDKWARGLDKLVGPAALAGGAAATALALGFSGAVANAGLEKRVSDQLGLTAPQAETAGNVAGQLYADGFGESMPDVSAAVSSVMGNIDGMRDASVEALSDISGQVLNVASTFDQDLGGVTTAVGQLMRTGLAPDAQSALDIITKGLQSNTRAGDDLIDTFTEYPALFQRLGIDGQTATGLISQGLDAGARSTDLVADALKEFQIRATDGSTTSAAGFEALGLSAADMTAQIAAGGDGAAAGLDAVLDGLRNMTDPVAQNAAAVALFGTQAEDLGGALFALDPSSAVGALGEVTDAASKLGSTDAETSLVSLQRTAEQSFTSIAEAAIPVITPILDGLKEFAPILGPLAVILGIAAAAVLGISGAMEVFTAVQAIQTAAQWASNAAWLANPITWIVLAIVAAIALMIAIIVLVIQNWDEIARVGADVWNGIIGWIEDLIEWLDLGKYWDAIVAGFTWIGDTATDIWNSIIDGIKGVISWVQDAIGWFGSLFGAQNDAASNTPSGEGFQQQSAMLGARMFSQPEIDAGFAGLSMAPLSFVATPAPAADFDAPLARRDEQPTVINNYKITVNGAVDKDGTARQIKKILTDYDTQNGSLASAGGTRKW